MRTALSSGLLALSVCSLTILAPLTGCAAVALGAVGGLVISNEMNESNIYETRLDLDVSKVWPTVKTTLSDASMQTIEIDEGVRMAKAKIDNATVTVWCEAYDLDKTVMRTRASKFAGTINDGEMAKLIQERIVLRLENAK